MPIQKLLNEHHKVFGERFSRMDIVNLGEDAIRYDFFQATMSTLSKQPWDIEIEKPMSSDAYVSIKNTRTHRKENPRMDLSFLHLDQHHFFEFALFKRNGNIESQINGTARMFKMFNDFIRLSIMNSLHPGSRSFFVCVADTKLLGSKLTNSNFTVFPAEAYEITPEQIEILAKGKTASKEIKEKFLKKFLSINRPLLAKRIFDKPFQKGINSLETRLICFEVQST